MTNFELVCLCRPGFEKEVAAELTDLAAVCEVMGYVKAAADSAVACFVCSSFADAQALMTRRRYDQLIFIRHWFISPGLCTELGDNDRATPLCERLLHLPKVAELEVCNPDTNDGKSLNALAKAVSRHMLSMLKKAKRFDKRSPWRAQLLFVSGDSAHIGIAHVDHLSCWPSGILRLKVPKAAPSRATLKLEEAWHQFVPRKEWEKRLAPAMKAVDLGAAPGGWTWQLVNKSMFVQAVDNGPMAESLMDSGQVKHQRVDGFMFEPEKAVHWLVCDIADKPARTTGLIKKWALNRWFDEAVFNLKLPMKQRYAAVMEAREQLISALQAEGINHQLRFKQLYHDREEVTAHLRLRNHR